MKVAFLSYHSGTSFRGAETYVHELANHLVTLGVSVDVFQAGGRLTNSLYRTTVVKPFSNIRTFTAAALRQLDPQTNIVIPVGGGWQTLRCRLWTWRRGKKLIVSGQSGLGRDDIFNLLCFPDVFVCLTEFQSHWAKLKNPYINTSVIANGVDTNKFNPSVKPIELNLPRPIILNVASLDFFKLQPQKGQELLIRAAAEISASVLLVGQGSREKELAELGHRLLGKRFQISHFPYSQMPAVYAACDLFSFPTSPWESFGIAIVEAMAANKPVVVSADPIRKEIIGNAGLTVDPSDKSAFGKALSEGLQKDWKNLPRQRSMDFSWDKIAKLYLRLFEKLT